MEKKSMSVLSKILLWNLIFTSVIGSVYGGCADKFKVYNGHSACLKKSSMAKSGQVNPDEVLAAHNKFRGKVGASNMLKMVWDKEVQMIAQRWADNCKIGHDQNSQRIIPGRFTLGQNIASSPGVPITWNTVVELFYNETVDFKYGHQNDLKKVGHYTQLTWAGSYVLGCGYSVCGSTHYYVCNYGPSGNHNGELGTPYKIGTPSCLKVTANLCDCGTTICEGGSSLDPLSCKCQCRKSFFNNTLDFLTGPKCRLNCTDAHDPTYCSGSYTISKCSSLLNVPFECPMLCKSCPYADPSYNGNGNSASVREPMFYCFIFIAMVTVLINLD